jgi:hypothetical protein
MAWFCNQSLEESAALVSGIETSIPKTEATASSQTLVPVYLGTRHHIPGDHNVNRKKPKLCFTSESIYQYFPASSFV